MKFENPFKLQNWKFKKFLIVILFFQLSLLGLFALNKFGIDTPIIRPLIGFIYLSFVPGYLLLRILRLHNLSSIESFLYALGLSLFVDMFVGFLMNMLYPILGITDKPITEVPIVLTMAGVVFLLCIIAYLRDKNYNNPDYIDLKDILNPQVLFLSLIPFMAIFGTYLVNYYHNNILLMMMIVVIALVALIVGFTNWIDEKYYPYVIWVIAIALILHMTLIGNNINITDGEGYVPNLTINQGMANLNISNNYFSVVGNTILTPIIILTSGLNIVVVYKLIYPFIWSLVPLGMYMYINTTKILRNKKEVFFVLFLYIVLSSFFSLMPFLKKQDLAMFFLVMFYMVIFNSKNSEAIKKILLLIFMLSLIWSHYGTACLIIGMIILSVTILNLLNLFSNKKNNIIINSKLINFVGLSYITIFIGWYLYISNSSVISTILDIAYNVIYGVLHDFLNPEASRGVVALTTIKSALNALSKIMFISIFLCAITGYLKLIRNMLIKRNISINKEYLPLYLSFSLYWIIIFGCALLPFFAVMNTSRLYILAYLLLVPYVIIGLKTIVYMSYKILLNKNKISNFNLPNRCIKIFSIFLAFYLLLTTGFINEVFKYDPNSLSLSQESIKKYSSVERVGAYYSFSPRFCDISMAKWISKNKDCTKKIWITKGRLDTVGIFQPYANIPYDKLYPLKQNTDIFKIQNNYICLYELNIKGKIGVEDNKYASKLIWYNITNTTYYPQLKYCSRIYDNNGGSQVLLS